MTNNEPTVTGPCTGINVLELATSMISGPMCGQLMGDLGAQVIKLEGLQGDLMRQVPPFKGDFSGQFLQFNRNKRSISVNLKHEEGLSVARRLIGRADVVIENSRPGVTDRWGLNYDCVKEINPRLIYVSVNGFGSSGPYAKLPAYDQVIQGLVGFMPLQGSPENPSAIRSVVVDKITALSAVTAILAALFHRERTGIGQRLEVRMLDAFASLIMPEFLAAYTFADDPAAPLPSAGIYRCLRTADGHLVGLIVQDAQFAGICRALGCEDLIGDERYSSPAKRFKAMDELLAKLEVNTRDRSTADLLRLLWADSDVAIAPVNSIEDFLIDPQVTHNGTVFTTQDSDLGSIRQLGPFANFEKSACHQFVRAPKLGEHTDMILKEYDFDSTSIASLRQVGAIR